MDIDNICLNCFKDKGNFEVCYHCGWIQGTPPEQAYHLHPGRILCDRYVIGTVVGFGGFGTTYKVWDTRLNSLIAVKEFFPSGLVSRVPGEARVVVFSGEKKEQYRHQMERFMEEARNMAKFANNPNIVKVFDYFEANNTAYIAMEFLDGITLKDYARDGDGKPAALPQQKVLEILEPLLNALEDMHKKGIIHRDISPDNVFITKDNAVKLLDFGAARLSAEDREETMMAIIKPGYAPPEQYRAKSRQGVYTDIYGLGATLYRIVTGDTPEESVDRQVEDILKKPSEMGIDIDLKLEKSIMKSLALKPEIRFQSVKSLREAVFEEKNVDYPEVELKKRRIMRGAALTAALVVIVSMTAIFGVYSSNRTTELAAEPGTIEMWLPSDAGTAYGGDAMSDILSEMQASYPGVDVRLSYLSLGQYRDGLLAAKQSGGMPDLFFTETLSGAELADLAAPLDNLLAVMDMDQYMFLGGGGYKNYFPKNLEMPLSFEMPVAYLNLNSAEFFGMDAVSGFTSISEFASGTYPWDIQPGGYSGFLALYGGLYPQARNAAETGSVIDVLAAHEAAISGESLSSPALSRLFDETLAFAIGTTADLPQVMNDMSGFYRVIEMSSGQKHYAEFRDTWAIDKAARGNEKDIAMLTLFYMASEYGQERLYLDNASYCPVNRAAFDSFLIAYPDLRFIQSAEKTTALWGHNVRIMRRLGSGAEDAVNTARSARSAGNHSAEDLKAALGGALQEAKDLK